MAKEGSRTSVPPLGLAVIVVFSALLAIAFGTGGYRLGLKPLALTLQAALQVSGWQPTPAQVLGARLQQHRGSGSTTWQ